MNVYCIQCPCCKGSLEITVSRSNGNSHLDQDVQYSRDKNEIVPKNYHQASANAYSSSTYQIMPSGLKNFGLICYVNSTIQCMCYVRSFRERVIKEHLSTDNKLLHSLGYLFESLYKNNENVEKAQRKFLNYFSDIAVVNQQGDVYEFLVNLLNTIKTSTNNNKLIDVFGAQKKLLYNCYSCRQSIDTIEPFLFLVLPFSNNSYGKRLVLQSLVNKMEEPIVSDWVCKKCKRKTNVALKTEFTKLPEVLMVRLKSSNSISIPVEYSSRLTINSKKTPVIYNLISVIYYYNGAGSFSGFVGYGAHYNACIRLDDGEWYHFNDSVVRKARQDQIYNPKDAFILFYQREMN